MSLIMTNTLDCIILGCGPSAGVPLGGYEKPFWGDCDPQEPRNRRTRSSCYVCYKGEGILVDAGPDLRHHLLTHGLMDLKEVVITHDHADHVHGLDDVRPLYFARGKKPYPLRADPQTSQALRNHFPYLFKKTSQTLYPQIFDLLPLESRWMWHDLPCFSFPQDHGYSISWGVRFGPMAYSTDFIHLSEEALVCLENLDLWIVDCLGRTPKPTHCHLERTLMWIEKLKPKQAILTHMNHELDYKSLCQELPLHIRPAYDGMTFSIAL
jgi:phosphoribosyl 1,2-cyclic phosphate phosphodiesterase